MGARTARIFIADATTLACAAVFLLIITAPPLRALADGAPSTVTIEASEGAIFISGPKDKAAAVRDDLSSLGAADWPLEKIASYITGKFPGELDAQVFRRSDAASLEDAENLEMPLRRAILIGLLPPVEGLAESEAVKVLEAAGISAFTQTGWAAMDQRERAVKLSGSSGQIAILNIAEPQETVRIILVRTDKKDAAN